MSLTSPNNVLRPGVRRYGISRSFSGHCIVKDRDQTRPFSKRLQRFGNDQPKRLNQAVPLTACPLSDYASPWHEKGQALIRYD